jgi:hypothetical protein
MGKVRQLNSAEREELQQLRKAYLTASAEAAAAIGAGEGTLSDYFAQAQEKVAVIARRIKELLGTANEPGSV